MRGTCRKECEEILLENRILERMRLAIVSLVSSMTRELSTKVDQLTDQVEQFIKEGHIQCPDQNWKLFKMTCYYFSKNRLTWDVAKL